jgi:electron transfer flavoprotein alpha subunit
MSVIVFVEGVEGEIKKSSLEAISYAAQVAKKLDTTTTALVSDHNNLELLGKWGADKVISVKSNLNVNLIQEVIQKEGSDVIIFPKSSISDSIAAKLSIKIGAGLVTNVLDLPDTSSGFKVKKSIYTGKAYSIVDIKTTKKILVVSKSNLIEGNGIATVEKLDTTTQDDSGITLVSVEKAKGDLLLTEADIIVSGGRGLKGPENWHLITELAKELGAATGCSKPVSDMDWRPHHEHIGQTGIKVSPNLYLAIGISGAIQHLAGVNSSKVIVVINKDPEAPFFKAADYGIVGDAFEIVPKLIEEVRKI